MRNLYLSYSRLSLYLRNPQEYFQRYILGIKEKETKPMILGKIAENAFCNPDYDYKKELLKNGFLPDMIRIIDKALKELPKYKKNNIEMKTEYILLTEKIPLIGYFDALDGERIIERKFGGFWKQELVDASIQLTFYTLLFKLIKKKMPKEIILHSICSKNGKVKTFRTKRTNSDLKKLDEMILFTWQNLKNNIYSHNYPLPVNNIWLR